MDEPVAKEQTVMNPRQKTILHISLVLLLMLRLQEVRATSYREPDVQVVLLKVDPRNGKVVWTVPLDRSLRPYRLEAYTNAIVAFTKPVVGLGDRTPDNAVDRRLFFIGSKEGKSIPAFDTRYFLYSDRDPQITRSHRGTSVHEERDELTLANGWRSYGVAGLAWRNTGQNKIWFFHGREMAWTMTLPVGAYNLANSRNILVYTQGTEENETFITRLYAREAGKQEVKWRFELPKDVPDRVVNDDPPFTKPRRSRWFCHLATENAIYVFGSGILFALNPETGAANWKADLWKSKIKFNESAFVSSVLIDGGERLIIYDRLSPFNREIYAFDIKSKELKLLQSGLYHYACPIFAEGYVYCFGQRDERRHR